MNGSERKLYEKFQLLSFYFCNSGLTRMDLGTGNWELGTVSMETVRAPFLTENFSIIQSLVGLVVHVSGKPNNQVIGSVIISQVHLSRSTNSTDSNESAYEQREYSIIKLEPPDEDILRIEVCYSASLKSTTCPTSLTKCINGSITIPIDATGICCFLRYGCDEHETIRLLELFTTNVLEGFSPVNSGIVQQLVSYRAFIPRSSKITGTSGLDTSFCLNIQNCAALVANRELCDTEWIQRSAVILAQLTLNGSSIISDYISLDKLINITKRKRLQDEDELHTLTNLRQGAKAKEFEKQGLKRKRRRLEKTMFLHLMDVRSYIQDELGKNGGAEYVSWPPDEYRYPVTTMPIGDSNESYSIVESWNYRLCMDEDVFNFKGMSRDNLDNNGCVNFQDVLGKEARIVVLSEWIFYIRASIFPATFDDSASLNAILLAAMDAKKLENQGSGPVANLCFLPAKMVVDGSTVLKHLYEDFVYRAPLVVNSSGIPALIHEPSNFFVDVPCRRKQRRTLLYDNLFDESTDNRDHYAGFLVLTCDPGTPVIECLVNAHKLRHLMRAFYHPTSGYPEYKLKDFGNTKPQQLSTNLFDINEFNTFVLVYARLLGRSMTDADLSQTDIMKYQEFCQNLIHNSNCLIPDGPVNSWLPEWISYPLEPGSIFLWNNKCPVRFNYQPKNPEKPLIGLELDYQPIDPSPNGTLTQPWYAKRMKRLMSYNVRSARRSKIKNQWEWPMISTLKKRKDELTDRCRLAYGPYTLYLFDKHPQYYQGIPNRNVDVLRGFRCHKEDGTIFSHKDYYESLNQEML